jgi:tRNA (guanosine-2'-O-)-methyltransferase
MKIDWKAKEIIANEMSLKPDLILNKITSFVTEERREKIDSVLKGRSAHFAPILESLYDRGNISAVMRSAEAFGFFKFHIIETVIHEFKQANRVTQGADKWLEVNRWDRTSDCIKSLKEDGYKVYATHMSKEAKNFEEIDFSQKTAVIFGNETTGVSEEALSLADGNVLLPMTGFSQSFNISVAGALSCQQAYLKRPPLITEEETELLKALYYMKSISWPEKALKEWFN